MTEKELGYTGGIVDGEGSICIVKVHGCTRPIPTLRAHVSVAQCDIRLPIWLKERFGGYVSSLGIPKGGRKQAYSWSMTGTKQCLPFLEIIRPYLLLKTQQADIAIAFMKARVNVRHMKKADRMNEFRKHLAYKDAIQKLNFRGVPPSETKRPGPEGVCDSPTQRGIEPLEVVRNGDSPIHVNGSKVTASNE